MEMEAASGRLNNELTQQLSHLRAESDSKSKTIANLEINIENISSHLSQTRIQLDELSQTSNEKAETIAHLRTQASNMELQQEKNKVELQAFAKSGQDRSKSMAELNADLACRSAEVHALEKLLSEKSDTILDLERKFADSQSGVEAAKQDAKRIAHQLEQKTKEVHAHKAEILAMAAERESERLAAQRAAGEIREELASLEVKLANVINELDEEKRERAGDAEKHKVTVNSLVMMIEGNFVFLLYLYFILMIPFVLLVANNRADILKRLRWELGDPPPPEDLPDLATYWSPPPHREVVPDMEARKASIDDAIKNIKANAARKSEMEAKLHDVATLLEAEKLVRAKLEVCKGVRQEGRKHRN